MITGFLSRYGCERCECRGTYRGRMVFLTTGDALRTDETFRRQSQVAHHSGFSPLLRVQGLDMVNDFSLDIMHLVFLGVVRKLVYYWIEGPKRTRIGRIDREKISEKLVRLKPITPSCFARKPRALEEWKFWKATEWRTFLLYTGPMVLRKTLPTVLYEHFLLLWCGITLLLRNMHLDRAQALLLRFVKQSRRLYGEEFMTHNVHAISHLSDDARRFGDLMRMSAFVFEDNLGYLKRLIRSGNRPAAQMSNRVCERFDRIQLHEVRKPSYIPSRDLYFLSDESLVVAETVLPNGDRVGKEYRRSSRVPFFSCPEETVHLGVFLYKDISSNSVVIPASSSQAFAIPYKKGFVAFPIIHLDE